MENKNNKNYQLNLLSEIRNFYKNNYGLSDISIVESVFNDVVDLFAGNKKGFLKCDTKYHDLLHTFQVVPPFLSIVNGWNKSGKFPKITKEYFEKGIIAVLLHDTGYIKTENDMDGTGAKYTFVHIQRSADFAKKYLLEKGFDEKYIKCVTNIIMCTGVKLDIDKIIFNSKEEKITGYALGTADLLGQMSAHDYIQKLHDLFNEFNEAYNFEDKNKLKKSGIAVFDTAEELIRNTPFFYENVVKERFKYMGSVYLYISENSENFIEKIEKNINSIIKLYLARQT